MTRDIEALDRRQNSLFPGCLDDYVSEDNPIRAIETFVDKLDFPALGFGRSAPFGWWEFSARLLRPLC